MSEENPLRIEKGPQPPPVGQGPELLAPAGNWACARAAVEAGADAIYFGLPTFNARMRADNFEEKDLPELMAFLHGRSVKGYVTLNTLVFENELGLAERVLRQVIEAGVDAAIVQDIGVCRMIRRLSPDFPIHASTQMTVTSSEGIRFAEGLGCHLVVMARECSAAELRTIRAELTAREDDSPATRMPLEVFVHGALCVAYSGQCLTSEALGGRSANRGECAQACRMTYDLYRDGERLDLGSRRYLLSPQDLMGLDAVPKLIEAGIQSFKIEGRLKSPEYVANVTSAYRGAIEAAMGRSGPESDKEESSRDRDYDLEMAFSRGLYSGWLDGIDNQALVHARFGKKRGVLVGAVSRVERKSVVVEARAEASLKIGDGIVFDQGRPDRPEQGGRVQSLRPNASLPNQAGAPSGLELGFRDGSIDFRSVRVGDKVWKTSDPEFERHWRAVAESERPRYRRPLRIRVSGTVGEPLVVEVTDDQGHGVTVSSQSPLSSAGSRPLDEPLLRKQLGRLGSTAFRLDGLDNDLSGGLILPISELNQMRREAVEALMAQRRQPRRWQWATDQPARTPGRQDPVLAGQATELIALIRSLEQLEPALAAGLRTIYCDFENPKAYREAVKVYREFVAGNPNGDQSVGRAQAGIFVAPPRIHKTGEDWILGQVRSAEPDGFLVRNYDHLTFYRGARLRGDFSYNVANSMTAEYLIEQFGLEFLTPSYDLNVGQLIALIGASRPKWFEVTLHQHMPMFHMEHCVFCAFMSKGKDYRDCGRPCEKHKVHLEDRVGQKHELRADVGCRNTVFNGRAQTGAEYLDRLMASGVRRFRIDFLNESSNDVLKTIESYQKLIRGEISGPELWQELRVTRQLGVTRGTLED